ncbi:MAG: hypothetical protein IT243_01380 [Bacteroidia bacterium]|nr:hypothetical protein [Bacteroidia bacterium]
MDQNSVNSINKAISVMLIVFGIIMLFIAIPLIFEKNRDSIINTMTFLSFLSSLLFIVGGIQFFKKTKLKEKAVRDYQTSIYEQLANKNNKVIDDTKTENISIEQPSKTNETDTYTPDVIAHWYYTNAEWKNMTKEERERRIKEGLWLSPLIGVLGTILLIFTKNADIITAFVISFSMGILISILKIFINNSVFKSCKENNIVFTTNALVINGKFKTINDLDIHLEYLKFVKLGFDNFIEFSLQWQVRGGVTNDQFRILIPEKYKAEAKKIFDYYGNKGVKIENF